MVVIKGNSSCRIAFSTSEGSYSGSCAILGPITSDGLSSVLSEIILSRRYNIGQGLQVNCVLSVIICRWRPRLAHHLIRSVCGNLLRETSLDPGSYYVIESTSQGGLSPDDLFAVLVKYFSESSNFSQAKLGPISERRLGC